AAGDGEVIKLVAAATLTGEDLNAIDARVVATRVPAAAPLGRTSGVLDRGEVDASPVGTVAFSGPGAGGAATSSAVLGDLLAIAAGGGSTCGSLPPPPPAAPGRCRPRAA